MACEPYRRMMIAEEDDGLGPGEVRELADHLSECAKCRAAADRGRRSLLVFTALERERDEADLSPGLAARVAEMAMEQRKPSRRRALLAAAIAALAVMASLFAGYALREPAPAPATAISVRSDGLGLEIDRDHFVLRARGKEGNKSIDLRF